MKLTLNNQTIDTGIDGYFRDPGQWNEDLACEIAVRKELN